MDLKENTRLITLAEPLHLGADLANGKYLLTFCVVCAHTNVGKDVFLFDSRSFGFAQVGVTFACDLILHGEMHQYRAGTCFSTFLAQMTPHSQKRNILILALSLSFSLSLFFSLSIGYTLTTCAHTLHLPIE